MQWTRCLFACKSSILRNHIFQRHEKVSSNVLNNKIDPTGFRSKDLIKTVFSTFTKDGYSEIYSLPSNTTGC